MLKKKFITVQPGITWSDVIKTLNCWGLAPKTLQSYSSFSVGGSVSVNAHGITSDVSVSESVVSLKMVTADGVLVECSKEQNAELFHLVLGGYGLWGVMYEITLNVTNNCNLDFTYYNLSPENFVEEYEKILTDPLVEIKLGRIDISDPDKITLFVFRKKDDLSNPKSEDSIKPVCSDLNKPREMSVINKLLYKWIMPTTTGTHLRHIIEKVTGKPVDWSDSTTRNELMYESAKPLAKLYSPLITLNRTHILQEFFIPHKNFKAWMSFLKQNISKLSSKLVSLLNITIRYLKKDNDCYLRYAKEEGMFAFVFYYRCERTEEGDVNMCQIHHMLTNKALELNGTFYLPYRHHYTKEQLMKAYPEIISYIDLKNQFDPDERFFNVFYSFVCEILKSELRVTKHNLQKVMLLEKKEVKMMDDKRSNLSNEKRSSYRELLSSDLGKQKMKDFLKHIFNMLDYKILYEFILQTYEKNQGITDDEMFDAIQKFTYSRFGVITRNMGALKTLSAQKNDFVQQTIKLLSHASKETVGTIAMIGDCGRFVYELKNKVPVNKVYVVHDKLSIMDFIEKGTMRKVGEFVKINYEKPTTIKIPDNSCDVVTCYMGLHHILADELDGMIKEIRRILKPNGLFIFREHDFPLEPNNTSVQILNVAHNCFNAVTGVTAEEEKKEIRLFAPIDWWIKKMANHKLYDAGSYEMQLYDPTRDFMIVVEKKLDAFERQCLEFEKTINSTEYKRDQAQTYMTPNEWFLVDIAQAYGAFMNHTPYYLFPYKNTIILFWKMMYNQLSYVKKNFGYGKSYFTIYTIANLVMGLTFTSVFGLLSVLSIVPRWMFTKNGKCIEPATIFMTIKCLSNTQFSEENEIKITSRIDYPNTNESLMTLEIPRYKKMNKAILELKEKNCIIKNLCGNEEIQIKLISEKELIKGQDFPIESLIFHYKYFNYCYNIKIKVSDLPNYLSQNHYSVHIFDY